MDHHQATTVTETVVNENEVVVTTKPTSNEEHHSSIVSRYFFDPLNSFSSSIFHRIHQGSSVAADTLFPNYELLSSKAEYNLLKHLKFYQHHQKEVAKSADLEDTAADVNQQHDLRAVAKTERVYIDDKNYIHTFMMDTDGDSEFKGQKKTLVLTHGFGAGLGFFFKTYSALARVPGWRIYAIDWLGMGQSSRAPLPPRSKNEEEDVEAVENYFTESFEKWRVKMNIDKMTLLGHSLGGYLSGVYSLKYPQTVSRLILVSPAGISRSRLTKKEIEDKYGSFRVNLLYFVWNNDITPQYLVRTTGPVGRNMIHSYAMNRFKYLEDTDKKLIYDYLYHISKINGTGEYALGRLLQVGGIARKPLEERLDKLEVPVDTMYGDDDWMDPSGAKRLYESGSLKPSSRYITVPRSSHQIYLDNVEYFNNYLVEYMGNFNCKI